MGYSSMINSSLFRLKIFSLFCCVVYSLTISCDQFLVSMFCITMKTAYCKCIEFYSTMGIGSIASTMLFDVHTSHIKAISLIRCIFFPLSLSGDCIANSKLQLQSNTPIARKFHLIQTIGRGAQIKRND